MHAVTAGSERIRGICAGLIRGVEDRNARMKAHLRTYIALMDELNKPFLDDGNRIFLLAAEHYDEGILMWNARLSATTRTSPAPALRAAVRPHPHAFDLFLFDLVWRRKTWTRGAKFFRSRRVRHASRIEIQSNLSNRGLSRSYCIIDHCVCLEHTGAARARVLRRRDYIRPSLKRLVRLASSSDSVGVCTPTLSEFAPLNDGCC